MKKVLKYKTLEGKCVYRTEVVLHAFPDTLPDKLTVPGSPGTELQDVEKTTDSLWNPLDAREVTSC